MAKATWSGVLGKREPQKYVLVGSESNCEKMGYAKIQTWLRFLFAWSWFCEHPFGNGFTI